jgi:hypothetical protein
MGIQSRCHQSPQPLTGYSLGTKFPDGFFTSAVVHLVGIAKSASAMLSSPDSTAVYLSGTCTEGCKGVSGVKDTHKLQSTIECTMSITTLFKSLSLISCHLLSPRYLHPRWNRVPHLLDRVFCLSPLWVIAILFF